MAEAFFTKSLDCLRPFDAEAEEVLSSIPHGATVKVKITRSRSVPHHNLFFGLLAKVYKNSAASERFKSFDTFRDTVAIGAGHFEWSQVGEYKFPVAKSISFTAVDQAGFNEFFELAIGVIDTKLGLVGSGELRREFEEMLNK